MKIEKNWISAILATVDGEVASLIEKEAISQSKTLRLIASENYMSAAVAAATASSFGNKYSEGYPYKWKQGERVIDNGRYYNGQVHTNALELLAIDRCLKLFAPGVESGYHANVQPLSGAPANLAVINAVLGVGDSFMGLSLDYGGHLTHGHKVSVTGKFFKAEQYKLGSGDLLDYSEIREIALKKRPKLIFCGATAYPREISFKEFGAIAKEVGAILVADISHISGLVACGIHEHPFPYADIITTTVHKLLRGPRSGLIICKKEFGASIDRSVFPGLQGGPHMNQIAGICVAIKEALSPEYREYVTHVVRNAKCLAEHLLNEGFCLVSGGTDTHLILIDVAKSREGLSAANGAIVADAAERAGIIMNRNTVPGDEKPWNPSGIRIGTPAITTLGMRCDTMEVIANWMQRVASNVTDDSSLFCIRSEVEDFMSAYAVP